MLKYSVSLFFISIVALGGCDFNSSQQNKAKNTSENIPVIKDSKEHINQIFIASSENFDIDKNIMFLEKEVLGELEVEKNCLIVKLKSEQNQPYLIVLNKNQNAVKDKGGLLIGIKDNKTNRTINLNSEVVLSGVSFEKNKMKPLVKTPSYCPQTYIMTGEIH